MLGFALFVFFVFGGAFFFWVFSGWVLQEHALAEKYRKSQIPKPFMDDPIVVSPSTPGWVVTYRDKGKINTVIIEGDDEATVLMKAIKERGVGYDKIISSVKR